MTLTLSKAHIAILIVIVLAFGGLVFMLWVQAHDTRVRLDATVTSNAPAIKQAQQDAANLAKQIQETNARFSQSQAAIDAKFDKLTTLTSQLANMATAMGMKQAPVIIQPGQVPQLPQGGVALSPQQVQNATDYEHTCDTCKNERDSLKETLGKTQGIVTAKTAENAKLVEDLKAARKAAKMGFRYKLLECMKRGSVGATSGAVGAAISVSNPLQGKPVGRAAAIGAVIGGGSCVIF